MMQQVNIREAAKLVKKSPKTLYAAIKSGKLSVSGHQDGQKIVAISELIRVYGEISKPMEDIQTNDIMRIELEHKVMLLSQENENLKQRLVDKENNLEDLRQTTKLIENYKPKENMLIKILKEARTKLTRGL